MTWLLDTNVCVDLLKGHPQVAARVEAVSPADCAVSSVTVFELAAGIRRCAQPERERKKIARLLAVVTVLPFDLKAAEEAARIRHELEAGGQKIGPYDLLIAGQALSASRTLISHNTREFSRIPGLRLADWRT
ncbi:MAG: type II toxin-antitoxin system VapC family toxin [Verrucomicrobiota bacterium]